jgi:holin-like protein
MHLSLRDTHHTSGIRGDIAVVHTFAALITLQGVGELLAHVTRVPIPGPVIGMALLVILLATSPPVQQRLEAPGLGLLNHLSLLFIPTGVGIVGLAGALRGQLIAIVVAIVVSTGLSVAVTGLVTCALLQRRKPVDGSAVRSDKAQ